MLPTLTFAPRRVAPRRAVTGVVAILLLAIAAAGALVAPAQPRRCRRSMPVTGSTSLRSARATVHWQFLSPRTCV
jgi:hypothetical protein